MPSRKRGAGYFSSDPKEDMAMSMTNMSDIKSKMGTLRRQSLDVKSNRSVDTPYRAETADTAEYNERKYDVGPDSKGMQEDVRGNWLQWVARKARETKFLRGPLRQKDLKKFDTPDTHMLHRNTPEQDAQLRALGMGGAREKRRITRRRTKKITRRRSKKSKRKRSKRTRSKRTRRTRK